MKKLPMIPILIILLIFVITSLLVYAHVRKKGQCDYDIEQFNSFERPYNNLLQSQKFITDSIDTIAYYKMDNITVNDGNRMVYDISQNGRHMQINGSVKLAVRKGKRGMWFDRNGHLELLNNFPYMQIRSKAISICFWYYQPEGGPDHYEPFVLLYSDDKHYIAVTDHWGDHRVDLKTSKHNWLVVTGPKQREESGWIFCAAVFAPEQATLILSENQVGDIARDARAYNLEEIEPHRFDKIMIGNGPGWVQRNRRVDRLRACVSDVMIFGKELDDLEIGALMRTTSTHTTVVQVQDFDTRGQMNVNGSVDFDGARIENQGDLDLVLDDGFDQGFQVSRGRTGQPHRFLTTDGSAVHEGTVDARNISSRGDVVTRATRLCAGGRCLTSDRMDALKKFTNEAKKYATMTEFENLQSLVNRLKTNIRGMNDDLDELQDKRDSIRDEVNQLTFSGVFVLSDFINSNLSSQNWWWRGHRFEVASGATVTGLIGSATRLNNFDIAIFEMRSDTRVGNLLFNKSLGTGTPLDSLRSSSSQQYHKDTVLVELDNPVRLSPGKTYWVAQGRTRGSGNHIRFRLRSVPSQEIIDNVGVIKNWSASALRVRGNNISASQVSGQSIGTTLTCPNLGIRFGNFAGSAGSQVSTSQ